MVKEVISTQMELLNIKETLIIMYMMDLVYLKVNMDFNMRACILMESGKEKVN